MNENITSEGIDLTEPALQPDSHGSLRSDIFGLGRKSLAYVVGHLATRAVSFLLLPLYTNALVPEDMGILSLAFAFSAFGLVVYRLGLDSALLRYYVGESYKKQRETATTVYIALMLSGLVISGIILSLRSPLAGSILGVHRPEWIAILTGIMFLDTLWTIPMYLFRADERPLPYITFSLVNVTITMVMNIVLVVHYDLGVAGALLANLCASTTLFLLTGFTIFRRLSLRAFSTSTLRILLKFGLPLALAGLFTVAIEMADRYLLSWLADLETVGLYSAGYKLGVLMLILVMGFNMGWQPFFLRRGKQPGAPLVFARITTYLVAFLGALLLIVSAWLDHIVRIPLGPITLLGSEYWSATGIVPMIMLGYILFGLYVLLLPGVHLTARTRWVMLFRGSGAATNVLGNIVLIPLWGAMGAATAKCVAFGVMALITFLVTRRFYSVPYEWGRLARIAGLIMLGMIILYTVPAGLGRNLILTFLMPVGLVVTGAPTIDERRVLQQFLRRS